MKLLIFFLLSFLFFKNSFAASPIEQFKEFDQLDISNTKIITTKDYYFSQVVYKLDKKFNRKKVSRKAIFESIDNFKEFIIANNTKDKKYILKDWGGKTYSKKIITIKNARKIKDIKKNKRYIVVYSFPKNQIFFNKKNFNLSNMISFNSQNHFNLPESERNVFLSKINLNDIELLWKIHKSKKTINLNNVIAYVDPIEYQKKLRSIYKFKNININHLNILPSTKFIVDDVIKNNDLKEIKKLTYMSSVCSHDQEFMNNIKRHGIITIDKDILRSQLPFSNYIKLCNGFMNFDKKLVKKKIDNFNVIEKKFKSGKVDEINNIHNLLEEHLNHNPLNFKAWNYLSAILRFKKKFDLALITSRVEISVALNNNNIKQYVEALKSYSKARLNFDKKITNYQKEFLKNLWNQFNKGE